MMSECAKESSVLAALATGSVPDELMGHLEECLVCQDARLVWSYLRECTAAEVEAEIAPAGAIWWRAQLAKKRADAQRSIAWIDTMQKIALAVLAMAVIAMGIWQGPKLLDVSPVVAAGSAAVLILLLASVIVVLGLERPSHNNLSRGM